MVKLFHTSFTNLNVIMDAWAKLDWNLKIVAWQLPRLKKIESDVKGTNLILIGVIREAVSPYFTRKVIDV